MRLVINLIQILRWLLQPEIWRFVGFAAAVVGLLCYALSSSFIHVFGDWNLLKIFLYSVFSFIICLVILCVKIWQHSRSLRFKAHAAFLVLTITSVYSFFSDKVMNGKPDAYTLTSCAAFAIMSLSLSRQIQCGFEVDLLYFFLGCLIVQLMKIKLQLGIVGVGFSYSLIILRSSFSSIDAAAENLYRGLQDENSVVIEIVTPELANTTDLAGMMEKLRTCVKVLQRENSNVIDMLLEQIKEYSELLVTDHDFMIDALLPETIKVAQETASMMVSAGFEKECSEVYSSCRRECLEECLSNKLFGLKKLSIEDVHKMPWKDLEEEINRWIKALKVALKILFPSERRLCDGIFIGFSSAADFSFAEVCRASALQLLNFADAITIGSRSPERLFTILDMFETLRDLIPEFESLFCDEYSVALRNEAITIWKRLGEAVRGNFMELENNIRQNPVMAVASGGLHPITRYVMNYLRAVCQYRGTLEQVFEDSSLSVQMHWVMEQLESNLEEKSKLYEDPALGYLFLINNVKYIVQITEDSELGTLLGNEWIQTHTMKVSQYYGHYERTTVDLTRSGRYGGVVQQLRYRGTQRIGKIRGKDVEGSERSKGPGREMQEIEALPTQPRKFRKNDPQQRTVFIAASQFENMEMPPEDGFTWRKYGQKEILGSTYPRSYYNCTQFECEAKKRVQRLGDNPSTFEVTYSGEHTCHMLPKRDSVEVTNAIFGNSVPPEPGANEAMEEVQNRLRERNKDLFLEFENLILCIPEAKLVAPVDGGHHPILDKVTGYLLSDSWSWMEKLILHPNSIVAYVAEKSSLGEQMEMTLGLLERTLVGKSESYEDPALRHFFMMNNWRHVQLQMVNERRGYFVARYSREKVRQNLELYQRSSWNKLLDFLELGSNESVAPNIAVEWMKGKLSLFNMHFSEMCRVQCTWFVGDEKLREEIIISLENILIPAYGIFLRKFQDILKNHAYDYIEYGLFDIKSGLNRLFS